MTAPSPTGFAAATQATLDSGFAYVVARAIGRVLNDYPLARERLAQHAGKTLDITVGPLHARLVLTGDGRVEPADTDTAQADAPPTTLADVRVTIPLALLPRLAARDEAALTAIAFQGDSECAHTLATLARTLEWDVEEDLSRVLGGSLTADAAAHRIVDSARRLHAWRGEARQRLIENLAEYLVHERDAFATQEDLAALRRDNIDLRDATARLEARVARLTTAVGY